METTRFDSRVVQNLRVTGALDNNGKQTVLKRCWATFKPSENVCLTPVTGTLATGHRGSFTPMRIFDYETKKGFAPPANATIVAVSVLGKTEADHEKLTNFRTSITTTPIAVPGFAIGVMRAPNPDTDTTATRYSVSKVVSSYAAGVATEVELKQDVSATRDVAGGATDDCNPYRSYYQYLSPVTQAGMFQVNKHIGVCQEYVDRTPPSTGALRIAWGAPPATANNGKNINDVVTKNPGLCLFITPQNPDGAGTALADNRRISLSAAFTSDITLDVIVELEYDENTDLVSDNSVAFSNLDLQNQTI